jgi:hypothetical protein
VLNPAHELLVILDVRQFGKRFRREDNQNTFSPVRIAWLRLGRHLSGKLLNIRLRQFGHRDSPHSDVHHSFTKPLARLHQFLYRRDELRDRVYGFRRRLYRCDGKANAGNNLRGANAAVVSGFDIRRLHDCEGLELLLDARWIEAFICLKVQSQICHCVVLHSHSQS